jgi:hypothetical protein
MRWTTRGILMLGVALGLARPAEALFRSNDVYMDMDADGRSDFAVFDQESGQWFVLGNNGRVILWAQSWGFPGCVPVPDHGNTSGKRADRIVYDTMRGTYFRLGTRYGTVETFGDGDGKFGRFPVTGDAANRGQNQYGTFDPVEGKFRVGVTRTWGSRDCEVVAGDFDGDSKDEVFSVYYKPSGTWFVQDGANGHFAVQWGFQPCIPTTGDYNNDGITDMAVFHPDSGTWYVMLRSNGGNGILATQAFNWGYPGCIPVPGNYIGANGDDFCVYDTARGYWYVRSLAGETRFVSFGYYGATPVVMNQAVLQSCAARGLRGQFTSPGTSRNGFWANQVMGDINVSATGSFSGRCGELRNSGRTVRILGVTWPIYVCNSLNQGISGYLDIPNMRGYATISGVGTSWFDLAQERYSDSPQFGFNFWAGYRYSTVVQMERR